MALATATIAPAAMEIAAGHPVPPSLPLEVIPGCCSWAGVGVEVNWATGAMPLRAEVWGSRPSMRGGRMAMNVRMRLVRNVALTTPDIVLRTGPPTRGIRKHRTSFVVGLIGTPSQEDHPPRLSYPGIPLNPKG